MFDKSARTPDSPPDSTQILCWSRISARSISEIPTDSSFEGACAAKVCSSDAITNILLAFQKRSMPLPASLPLKKGHVPDEKWTQNGLDPGSTESPWFNAN